MKKSILTVTLALMACVTFATNSYENSAANPTNLEAEVVKKEALTSFCRAVMKGDLEMVKQLIELGEDVNQISLGKTPAMYAARYNRAKVLQLLIDHGADLKKRSYKERYTAKKFAELSNAKEALLVINQNGKK